MKQRVLARYFFILLGLLLSIGPATQMLAQTAKGTVHGQVTDPSGAVIPNANVSLTTPDGHTVATVTSNANGSYQVNSLAIGMKANPVKHLLVTANVTIKIGDGGLRAKVIPLAGISYSFQDLGLGILRGSKCPCPKE